MPNLLTILFDLFSPEKRLPNLSEYGTGPIPKRKVILSPDQKEKGQVINGKRWETKWGKKGEQFVFEAGVTNTAPAKMADVVLDAFDIAALNLEKPNWRNSENIAVVIKWHWLNGLSAKGIEKEHTANGLTEKGFSERNVSVFIKAFFLADSFREKEGKERLRK